MCPNQLESCYTQTSNHLFGPFVILPVALSLPGRVYLYQAFSIYKHNGIHARSPFLLKPGICLSWYGISLIKTKFLILSWLPLNRQTHLIHSTLPQTMIYFKFKYRNICRYLCHDVQVTFSPFHNIICILIEPFESCLLQL